MLKFYQKVVPKPPRKKTGRRKKQPRYDKGETVEERNTISDAMKTLNKRRMKKYGKEWRKEHARDMAAAKWQKWREAKAADIQKRALEGNNK